MSSNEITVLFFATLRDRAGTSKTRLNIPEGMLVADFKSLLAEKFPDLKVSMDSVLVSVEREFAFDDEIIPNGAEVALFPPVSGGNDLPTIFAIVEDEVDMNDLL
jgi:molybdopterin synthase catalytic subunit